MRCMLSIFDHIEADRTAEMGECGGDRLCWQWILYRPGHLHNTGSQKGGCNMYTIHKEVSVTSTVTVYGSKNCRCNIYTIQLWQSRR